MYVSVYRIFRAIRAATHCNTLQHSSCCNTLLAATHCNTLQHTAPLCSTLHHTAPLYNTLQHTITHCSTLQHNATQWYHMGQTGRSDHASLLSPARLVLLQLVHSRRGRFSYKLIHWFYYLFFIRIHYSFFVLCLLCITNHCHVLFFIYYLAFQNAASTDTSLLILMLTTPL